MFLLLTITTPASVSSGQVAPPFMSFGWTWDFVPDFSSVSEQYPLCTPISFVDCSPSPRVLDGLWFRPCPLHFRRLRSYSERVLLFVDFRDPIPFMFLYLYLGGSPFQYVPNDFRLSLLCKSFKEIVKSGVWFLFHREQMASSLNFGSQVTYIVI